MADTFGSLLNRYNVTPGTGRPRLFAEIVSAEAAAITGARILDIGCGTGIGTGDDRVECLGLIRRSATELWGVEPDRSVNPSHGLLDRLLHGTLEEAVLPKSYFDVAYAFLVMEHVQDPRRFLNSLREALKPGGVFYFLTLNERHYFTRLAKLSKQLRVDEHLLRLLRPKEIDDYHYPVAYRFNSPKRIEQLGHECGFGDVSFVFQETNSPLPYFPGPLRPLMHLLDRARPKRPEYLLNLIGRMVRT